MVADHVLERDCLDPAWHHRAVLGLADQIGRRLRGEGQVAGRLALTVRYADRSSSTRTRTLPEPTSHSPALAATALSLLTALGLQRARVRAFAIRADGLLPAGSAYWQLSLDPGDARARAAEAAADRARRRFGTEAVRPAALAAAFRSGQPVYTSARSTLTNEAVDWALCSPVTRMRRVCLPEASFGLTYCTVSPVRMAP